MLMTSRPSIAPASASSSTITSGFSSAIAATAALPSGNARTGMSACVISATAASRVAGSSSIRTTLLRRRTRIGDTAASSSSDEARSAAGERSSRSRMRSCSSRTDPQLAQHEVERVLAKAKRPPPGSRPAWARGRRSGLAVGTGFGRRGLAAWPAPAAAARFGVAALARGGGGRLARRRPVLISPSRASICAGVAGSVASGGRSLARSCPRPGRSRPRGPSRSPSAHPATAASPSGSSAASHSRGRSRRRRDSRAVRSSPCSEGSSWRAEGEYNVGARVTMQRRVMQRPPAPDLAAQLFGSSPERTLLLMRAAWPVAVGPELARRTEVVALDREVLRVRVPDATWQRGLARMRGDIMRRLREIAGAAAPRSLGFVLGPVSASQARETPPRLGRRRPRPALPPRPGRRRRRCSPPRTPFPIRSCASASWPRRHAISSGSSPTRSRLRYTSLDGTGSAAIWVSSASSARRSISRCGSAVASDSRRTTSQRDSSSWRFFARSAGSDLRPVGIAHGGLCLLLLVRYGFALEPSRHRSGPLRPPQYQVARSSGTRTAHSQATAAASCRTVVQSSVRPMSMKIGTGDLK